MPLLLLSEAPPKRSQLLSSAKTLENVWTSEKIKVSREVQVKMGP